ncbi:unnamed protein product [marine sediment metagenome]|uniref:Uncharacterized protein n=1 Tax=marine sediment metagenome TaxID=412755 RepID=X1CQL9_9ZZZZ
MMTECDFYSNLYDDFVETRNDENDKILWKTYKIIDLMKISDDKYTSGFMENGLRMIMFLFKHFKMCSSDLCSNDLFDAPYNEKEDLKLILHKEFT